MLRPKLILLLTEILQKFIFSLSHHRTSTAHSLFKVGPDAGPYPTRVRQNPKKPSAPSAFPQWGRPRCQEINKKHDVFYTFAIPEVTLYEPLYNSIKSDIVASWMNFFSLKNHKSNGNFDQNCSGSSFYDSFARLVAGCSTQQSVHCWMLSIGLNVSVMPSR